MYAVYILALLFIACALWMTPLRRSRFGQFKVQKSVFITTAIVFAAAGIGAIVLVMVMTGIRPRGRQNSVPPPAVAAMSPAAQLVTLPAGTMAPAVEAAGWMNGQPEQAIKGEWGLTVVDIWANW